MIHVNRRELVEGHPRYEDFCNWMKTVEKAYTNKRTKQFSVTLRLLPEKHHRADFIQGKKTEDVRSKMEAENHMHFCNEVVETKKGKETWTYGEEYANDDSTLLPYPLHFNKKAVLITDIELAAFLLYSIDGHSICSLLYDKRGNKGQAERAGKLFEVENILRAAEENEELKAKELQVNTYLWGEKLKEEDIKDIAKAMGMNNSRDIERPRIKQWIENKIKELNIHALKSQELSGNDIFLKWCDAIDKEKNLGKKDEEFEVRKIVQELLDMGIIKYFPEDSQWFIMSGDSKTESIARKIRNGEVGRRDVLISDILDNSITKKTVMHLWDTNKPEIGTEDEEQEVEQNEESYSSKRGRKPKTVEFKI